MAHDHRPNIQDLCDLLCESFTPSEFVRFIKRCEDSHASTDYRLIHNLLPCEYTPTAIFFDHALQVMERRNLVDAKFLDAMAYERPFRAQRIGRVARALDIDIDRSCASITASCDRPEPRGPAEHGAGEARRRTSVDHLDELLRRRFESPSAALAGKEEVIRVSEEIINSFTPRPGLVVAGAILERRHEAGAFGQIWLSRAVDNPGRLLATKIIHLHHLRSGQFLYHFRRGCRAMQILNGGRELGKRPSIVQLHDLSEDTLAFSMDYLPNGNLVEIATLQWSLETKLAKFRTVCDAIAFAHRSGIVHRDIRPANIVLDAANEPVVTDFDIADADIFTKLSITVRLGTQAFAAPEQLRGKKRGEATADVYSLGRLLHFMLIERDPPEPKLSRAVVRSLRSFPETIVRLIVRATAEDPRERHQGVAELLADLDRHEVEVEVKSSPAVPAMPTVHRGAAVGGSLMASVGLAAAWMFGLLPAEQRLLADHDDPRTGIPAFRRFAAGPGPASSCPPEPEVEPVQPAPPKPPPTPEAPEEMVPELPTLSLGNLRVEVRSREGALNECRIQYFAPEDGSVRFVVGSDGQIGYLDRRYVSHPYKENFSDCVHALLAGMTFAPTDEPKPFLLHVGCANRKCSWHVSEA